jgi:hypothetical protein
MTVVGPSACAKEKGSQSELARSYSANDIKRRSKIGTRGPYEMLVKERLMGIYLAIFVHRDAKNLVLGESILTLYGKRAECSVDKARPSLRSPLD